MIAKKKQTRLKPLSPTVKKRLKERGEPIGRTVKRPPKKRDRMGPKILRLEAPLPGKPRTKKRPKLKGVSKGLGSLVGGVAGSVLKKAAGKPKPKKKFGPITPKRGKPQFMKK